MVVLAKSGLTLRTSKCRFLAEEITFLGLRITENGITPGEENVFTTDQYPRAPPFSRINWFLSKIFTKFHLVTRTHYSFWNIEVQLGRRTNTHALWSKKNNTKFIQEYNGDWKPVFYFSRHTNEAEKSYHSYELEVLAIVETLQRFRIYLLGKLFRVVNDCAAVSAT